MAREVAHPAVHPVQCALTLKVLGSIDQDRVHPAIIATTTHADVDAGFRLAPDGPLAHLALDPMPRQLAGRPHRYGHARTVPADERRMRAASVAVRRTIGAP